MLANPKSILLWLIISLSAAGRGKSAAAEATAGILDLRGYEWDSAPTIKLSGQWLFQPHRFTTGRDTAGASLLSVPSTWSTSGPGLANQGFGTYRLTLLLGPEAPRSLNLSLEELMTAYELEINGQLVGGKGQIGQDRKHNGPFVVPAFYALPTHAQRVDIVLRISNFHLKEGGLVVAPVLGRPEAIGKAHVIRTVIGGVLIGFLLFNAFYQLLIFAFSRKYKIYLLNGLWTILGALHFLFLHERWMYLVLGKANWELCYRLNLATLLGLISVSFLVHRAFLAVKATDKVLLSVSLLFACGIPAVLLGPFDLAATLFHAMEYVRPPLLMGWFALAVFAVIKGVPNAWPMLIATFLFFIAGFVDFIVFGAHIGSLRISAYFLAGLLIGLAWMLARRILMTDLHLQQTSAELTASNAALEESVVALADHNQRLETTVKERTTLLVEEQKRAHALEKEQKRRDMEALIANNQLKAAWNERLLQELQSILDDPDNSGSRLRMLIGELRGQSALESRVQALQEDLSTVNSDFFDRLLIQCPELTKTEREICALLKLNLSSKEIAHLRHSNINAINAIRHRVRQKLNLDRDTELEAYIQAI